MPLFRMHTMHGTASMFLVSEAGSVLEYYWNGLQWVWLHHAHSRPMDGVLTVYNGSVFAVDDQGGLLVRERHGSGLRWRDCSAPVPIDSGAGGSSRHGFGGLPRVVHPSDQEFFISKHGTLVALTVAFSRYKWKSYGHPPNVELSAIADASTLRKRAVFVIGDDGLLYMCNTVAGLSGHWSGDLSQPPHIRLSPLPGTVLRRSQDSTAGSLFMRTEDGGIAEVAWRSPTWQWIEHGSPRKRLAVACAPGPVLNEKSLFLTVRDGTAWELALDGKGVGEFIEHNRPVLVKSTGTGHRSSDLKVWCRS